jgi:chromosome partitioning protein
MTQIIAVANQKGGVGKTTTALAIAYYFSSFHHRTLVVDFDVQGQVSSFLGLKKSNGLYRLLVDEEPVDQIAVAARAELDVIANDKTNERVTAHMMQQDFREYAVARALESAINYELIILDMPPSANVLHVASLVAADYVVIPAKMDWAALEGVSEILTTIRSLARIPSVTPPALIGVLPTMYDRTTNETVENIKRLKTNVGADQILPPIPTDTRVREANARGLTIWEYAPTSPAALGYQNGSPFRNSKGFVGGYLHLAEITQTMLGIHHRGAA